MLNLIFSRYKADDNALVYDDSRILFTQRKRAEWFQDQYVQRIIKEVDGATVVDGLVLKSRYGQIIPPEYLSTGSQTAICVYEFPDYIFNATQMGDNALYFALKLAVNRNITLLTYRSLPLYWLRELSLQKDYKSLDIAGMDNATVINLFDEWLKEGLNDD